MKILCMMLALCSITMTHAQQTLRVKVIHADLKEPLSSATITVNPGNRHAITDSNGVAVMSDLGTGSYKVSVSYAGYTTLQKTVNLPMITGAIEFALEPEEEEEEEVIVQSTRTSRNIRDVPTRVEVIELEEIDEKSNMRPANVSMLLHESTGIQVQQTSATSGNAGIRIQGLDGRYTQLLKDGFANFGNFASGLSVLEIPPLDLQQVEIIKGPASTLYGGGAIAGVINFISKTPKEKGRYQFLLNQSSIGQTNVGFFGSKRNQRSGYTILALVNNQQRFDVDNDDFTEVPKAFEWIIHPKLFLYGKSNSTFTIGNSFTKGNRKGGDVQVIRGKADNFHRYFEENNTIRNITTLEYHKKREQRSFTAKTSLSVFDRHIRIPDYHFDGININSFTDVSWLHQYGAHAIVTGGNLIYDNFNEKASSDGNRDNDNLTGGVYVQDTWDATEWFRLESGIRLDVAHYNNPLFSRTEFFPLPRVSALFRFNEKVTSRVGAGMGYKLPTLFTERTETFQYQGIAQLVDVKAERSYGGTADINLRTKLGPDFDVSFNQLFFLTSIDKPLVLDESNPSALRFINATRAVLSKGFETNAKLIYRHNFKLFLGYTFTDARAKYLPSNTFLPLVPKHKFNSALIYEKHDFIKLGLEAYYTSPQYLFNGFRTDDFWELGFMAEKLFEKFSVYINFENFTDTRQSRFKRVANDPHSTPTFDDIWTHTEGFVINGGIKVKI